MNSYQPIATPARVRSGLWNNLRLTTFVPWSIFALLLIGCASHHDARNGQAYPYKAPLSSPGQKFSGLPPAVQASVRAQVGGAEIHDIEKLNPSDRTIYRIIFRDAKLFPPLYVKADGSVLYPDMQHVAVGAGRDDIGAMSGGADSGLRLSDLPQKVVSTIQEKAPTAEVAFISKMAFNDRVFYEVSFKDPLRNPKIVVAENGELVKKIW